MLNLLFTPTSADILFMLKLLIGPLLVIVLAVAAYLFTRYRRPQGTKLKGFPQVTQDIEAYLESQGEKHSLTATDLQIIEKHEKAFRNAYLALSLGGVLMGLACAVWGMTAGKHLVFIVIPLSAVCVVACTFMARHYITQSGKRLYAARSGCCTAYILEVSEKLWYFSSGTEGGDYYYFIRCGECLVQVPGIDPGIGPGVGPSRKIYDKIGGRLLVVNYSFDPKGAIISCYPVTM
jgi:hypothetical protein